MSDALGLIGFYFTLIGFISGLFFTRLDSWFGEVQAFFGKVGAADRKDVFDNLHPEGKGLRRSKPFGSFISVGLFLSGLVILSYLVPLGSVPLNPILFLYGPLTLTVVLFWIGGFLLMHKADDLMGKAEERISAGRKGSPLPDLES